jgi:membrane fusion protein, heavy metal efflux system
VPRAEHDRSAQERDTIVRITLTDLCPTSGVSMSTSAQDTFLLGISAIAILAAIGATSIQESGAQTLMPAATMLQTAPTAVLDAGAHQPSANQSSDRKEERTSVMHKSRPQFIKEGQLIKIPQDSPLRNALIVRAVAGREIERTLTLSGVVEADPSRTVQLLPPVAGKIVDLKVQRGDRVVQNQELAVIYTGLGQAYSADRRVGSTRVFPNKPTARDLQTDAPTNLSGAAIDCESAEAEPARSAARLCALIMPAEGVQETRLLSLRAPTAGSVIDLGISPGTVVNDPSSAIMTMADLDSIWVTTSVGKEDAALIATGRPAEIAFVAYPNEVFRGEARFISDALDREASSLKVRIELENPSRRLKLNMFALATFLRPKETATVIPATALIRKNKTDWVFIEVEQWTFEPHPVKVDFLQDDQIVAVSGLNIGQRIVVVGAALLED